jgi:hypothetical protein
VNLLEAELARARMVEAQARADLAEALANRAKAKAVYVRRGWTVAKIRASAPYASARSASARLNEARLATLSAWRLIEADPVTLHRVRQASLKRAYERGDCEYVRVNQNGEYEPVWPR